MRQDKQQVSNDQPEAVRSAPVPVPPGGDGGGRTEVPEDALDDRGTFDDPSVTGDDARTGRTDADDDTRVARTAQRDAGEGGFHEPGPVPTALGAPTVAGAVAASALASPRPEDEPDAREERTARPGDGAEEGTREGPRADPTAELHRRGTSVTASAASGAVRTDPSATRTVVPPGAVEGGPERRADLTASGGDPDAGTVDAAGYGSPVPGAVDPDAVSPDADPTRSTGHEMPGSAPAGRSGTLASAGTARPAGSTVAAEPASLFDALTAQGFRDRWRDVQLRFVDDPRAAAGHAEALVEEAIEALSAALAAQKSSLGSWQGDGSADTEELRMAVRRYRDFLDRVLGR
ncbi:hypothetical protein D7147_19300 [Micromonospora musae]|uniref:Uncharacterized protein n=1 Tax=Micromonospora musae TaxID=1894970 RepID=A0A3A9XPK7_9ACTN|nr:hypothetical protein D7147_19300 [Micromonospora musae]RKN27069.1 hypothetical protein D7044_28480 [Micromonospora musae]